MNKTITLIVFCFTLCLWQLQAQTVNVTVTVDASNETVDATGVHVAGNWDPDNTWNPSAFPMNDNGDGTWSLTLEVAENSSFEYKFLLGNDWGLGNEGIADGSACIVGDGNNNRIYTVGTEDVTIPTVCYNSCASCKSPNESTVTFKVDLSTQSTIADSVFVAGSFNGWSNMTRMIDYNGDSVYTVAVNLIDTDTTYQYKFKNGPDGWEGSIPGECNVGGNRAITLTEEDLILPVVCFESCDPCGGVVQMTNIRFLVDMTNVDVLTGISDSGVHVAGSWQSEAGFGGDWDPGASMLTDADGDLVYELIATVPEGTYQYKYVNGNAWGNEEAIPSGCEVNGNREVEVTGMMSDTMDIGPICFGTCSAACPPILDPVTVTFRVDMINEFLSEDGLYLTGTVLTPAWRRDSLLMEEGSTDLIYHYTLELRPGEWEYKFVNGGTEGTEETGDFIAGGCGVDNGFGGSNRLLVIPDEMAGGDTTLPAFIYNSCEISERTSTNFLSTVTDLKVFPNPVSVRAVIQYTQLVQATHDLEIFDLRGQRVFVRSGIQGETIEINTSGFAQGVYIGKLSNRKNESATFRLVVQ